MQHPDIQPEDVQTSHDADLFKDDEDEDDDESGAGHFTDALTHPPTSISQPPTSISQPPTSAMRIDKRTRDEVVSEKRRFHEVDYSETLRKTVYEQEERINNIKRETEARERHMHDVNEKTRQWEAAMKEREQERQRWGRTTDQANANDVMQLEERTEEHRRLAEELARRDAELSARKNQELQEREKAIFAEMERRLQLEVEKLRAAKENELANMEQRFARSGRQQHAGTEMDMDQDPTPRSTQQQPRTPQKSQLKTPCLDVIKKIRKAHGATRKIRLVSVAEVKQSPTVEQEPPEFQQDDAYPMSAMENAVSRGVEAALRRIFIDKDIRTSAKRSPRRKRKQDDELRIERAAELSHERDFVLGEVRRLLKDTFSICQDADFIVHQPAIREDVYSYEYEDGPGPDTQNLAFDLKHGSSTPWNAKILDILLEKLQMRSMEEKWPFPRSDGYYKAILEDRYKRLRTGWRAAQPKITAKGVLETGAEVEERLIAKRDRNLKSIRQTTRRRSKYTRRATILQKVIELKKEDEDDDLPAWQWLQKLIKTLGDDGMSSEESDIENDVECVLRVKNMTWRRGIERELSVIDNQRVLDDDIFAPQGSKPMKRIRAPGNSTTLRSPVTGLPKALYDAKWIDGLTKGQVER
ncbi:hypothetical protein P692DRAFT_20755900 [Suillus brevipes Sb2]|nr:hypothetical protein P692DRAFT_20755900 [Suillus brevipes Sb2]